MVASDERQNWSRVTRVNVPPQVYNANAQHTNGQSQGAWGTVCGHYYWDNDNAAGVACRQLGFADGFMYTFGATTLLPTLPIVTGFRTCAGTEANLFACEASAIEPTDRDRWIGCRGDDGISGTADDTIDPVCTHNIDQGVICQVAESPQARNQATTNPCHGANAGRGVWTHSQPIDFSCIEYYTTQVRVRHV